MEKVHVSGEIKPVYWEDNNMFIIQDIKGTIFQISKEQLEQMQKWNTRQQELFNIFFKQLIENVTHVGR